VPRLPVAVYPAGLLLAFVLPFEAIRPVLVTPWVSLTDEKLVLLIALLAWVGLGARALPTAREWRGLLPSLALLLVGLVSGLLAPDFGDEAVRFLWRIATATFVFLLALRLARDRSRAVGLLWAIVLGAGVSALLGLVEAIGWPAGEPILSLFKTAPTRVGGDVRVSASFQYATIAAMYFEMAAPLAIVLSATAERRFARLIGLAIAAACTANVVLSMTRAGMLTLALMYAFLLVGAWLFFGQRWRRLLLPTLASAGVLIGGVAMLILRDPVFDMRMVTESDADWYGAVYAAPAQLLVEPNQLATVELEVRNAGRMVWSRGGNHPFALGYRWLTADGSGVLDVPPGEVPLSRDVAPGETLLLQTSVRVPDLPAASYRLDWGMLQRDVLQFYERGWADAETLVEVQRSASERGGVLPGISSRDDGEAPWVVGRLDLWSAAIRLIQTRPLLGFGPDNFRHLYGAELGLETWDQRVQANNLYLELLVDFGVFGLAAFVWLVVPPLVRVIQTLRERGTRNAELGTLLGLGLGILAFLVHGLLDSFLAFTPTALLFWMLLGLTQPSAVSNQEHVTADS
jgi:hypothetical protein